MKLQVKYNDSIHHPVAAAFLRGNNPIEWLKEIDGWNLPVKDLHCYVVPDGQTPAVAGLFVIFDKVDRIKQLPFLDSYSCLANKLYIPVNTELYPQISQEELTSLLIWDKQVLFPSIGFIGFEKKDRLDLASIFNYNQPVDADWSFAHPGNPDRPTLQLITITPATNEEFIKSVKEEIGQKSLENIPNNPGDNPSIPEKILDYIKWIFLALLGLLLLPLRLLPRVEGNNPRAGTGLFGRLQNWIEKNLDQLQKKRNSEIKRLLKLFDQNKDEALQYAIPLDSPYLNRGKQSFSSKLTRRNLKLNLGRLGGGQMVDSWDVSDYYIELRQKYMNAAQREIAEKNFKKAAYIYVHLLGDFRSAANVLEQAGMYREAAVLYKDHLKNELAAAECLEKGKLYLEAIALYKPLGQHEKTGDLYSLLGQKTKGRESYETYIKEQLMHNNYLDASRVMNVKMDEPALAKKTLLDGWKSFSQPENCLVTYFDIVLEKENDIIEKSVKDIYTKHTPELKRISFLNVLENVTRKKNDPEFSRVSQDIAYEVVNNEVEKGNVSSLTLIKKFLPGDRLVTSDTSRYTNLFRPGRNITPNQQALHLDQTIRWIKAVWHRNQFLVLGIKNNNLQMARCNWYGNLEYYSWSINSKVLSRFTFISAPYYSNTIILHSTDDLPVTRKNLSKNKYFNEALIVYCPVWMHKGSATAVINEEKNICRLEDAGGSLCLQYYDIDGKLLKSILCVTSDNKPVPNEDQLAPNMINFDGYYYICRPKEFLLISKDGITKVYEYDTMIRFFAASHSFKELYLVVSAYKGCQLYKPANGDLNPIGGFFAPELIPSHISFISSSVFIIAEKKKAHAFEIIENTVKEIAQFEVNNTIIGVLPTSDRFKFGLLEESGRITQCEISGKY
jgi:hypothetical protein